MSQYIYLIAPIVGWALSQVVKLSLNRLNKKALSIGDIFSSGNMPSSHVCGSTALITVIASKDGLSSPLFALGFVFTVLIAYDSVGVRRTAAESAEAINNMLTKRLSIKNTPLHVYKGHTIWEVAGGVLLGLAIGLLLASLL